MGCELVSDSQPSEGAESDIDSTPYSFSEIFDIHLPQYLAMGMTVDEFYNQDCCLVRAFRKAHEIKKQQKNYELWLQGLYIYEAMGDMSPILVAFPGKNAKPIEYPTEPYPITKKEMVERKLRDERRKQEMMIAKMKAMTERFNAKFVNKEVEHHE